LLGRRFEDVRRRLGGSRAVDDAEIASRDMCAVSPECLTPSALFDLNILSSPYTRKPAARRRSARPGPSCKLVVEGVRRLLQVLVVEELEESWWVTAAAIF